MSNSTSVNVQPLFNAGILVDGNKSTSEWMSVQEASNATGLSMGTLRRYIKSGKIKSRRLGRTINSKLEVFITPALLPDQPGQTEYASIEEVESDEVDDFHEIDQSDQSMEATLSWMRQKLDEKDTKIEALSHELAGANYRNGYLEMEKNKFEERVLLLEDKSGSNNKGKVWTKISSWFVSKSK